MSGNMQDSEKQADKKCPTCKDVDSNGWVDAKAHQKMIEEVFSLREQLNSEIKKRNQIHATAKLLDHQLGDEKKKRKEVEFERDRYKQFIPVAKGFSENDCLNSEHTKLQDKIKRLEVELSKYKGAEETGAIEHLKTLYGSVDNFIKYHHNPIIKRKNEEISALELAYNGLESVHLKEVKRLEEENKQLLHHNVRLDKEKAELESRIECRNQLRRQIHVAQKEITTLKEKLRNHKDFRKIDYKKYKEAKEKLKVAVEALGLGWDDLGDWLSTARGIRTRCKDLKLDANREWYTAREDEIEKTYRIWRKMGKALTQIKDGRKGKIQNKTEEKLLEESQTRISGQTR